MYKEKLSLGSNDQLDDIRWLCSLNESELKITSGYPRFFVKNSQDFVMSLKLMVLQRENFGTKAIGKDVDLKFLRALSFILMNKLKCHLQDTLGSTGSSSSPLDECNLLKFNLDDSFKSLSREELNPYICSGKTKRVWSALLEDLPPPIRKPRNEG